MFNCIFIVHNWNIREIYGVPHFTVIILLYNTQTTIELDTIVILGQRLIRNYPCIESLGIYKKYIRIIGNRWR